MNQQDLIKDLGISASSFRRWRSALGIAAKEVYQTEEIELFQKLKANLNNGLSFDESVANITGKPVNDTNPFNDALVKGFKPQLQKQADVTGQALALAFEEMVWDSFLKNVSRSKGSKFDECVNNFSLTVDSNEPLEAVLIEGSSYED